MGIEQNFLHSKKNVSRFLETKQNKNGTYLKGGFNWKKEFQCIECLCRNTNAQVISNLPIEFLPSLRKSCSTLLRTTYVILLIYLSTSTEFDSDFNN